MYHVTSLMSRSFLDLMDQLIFKNHSAIPYRTKNYYKILYYTKAYTTLKQKICHDRSFSEPTHQLIYKKIIVLFKDKLAHNSYEQPSQLQQG